MCRGIWSLPPAADWRGETVADRYGQWTAARHAYYQEHGEPCHALGGPHNQYGDFIDVLNREGEVGASGGKCCTGRRIMRSGGSEHEPESGIAGSHALLSEAAETIEAALEIAVAASSTSLALDEVLALRRAGRAQLEVAGKLLFIGAPWPCQT